MENLIPIIFDVPEHSVRVETFVASAEATQRVVKAFSNELFGDSLTIEVVVVAPEPGSLRQILKVSIKIAKYTGITIGTAWAVIFSAIQALETDIGKSAIEGFTGQSPSEIAKEVAQKFAINRALDENEDALPFVKKAPRRRCAICSLTYCRKCLLVRLRHRERIWINLLYHRN